MPILYALVARRTNVVLAEYSTQAGNANTVARAILEKLPASDDTRVSYAQDKFLFHVLCSAGFVYLCMAGESFGRRAPYAFLDEIRHRFSVTYGEQAATALPYAFNVEFSRTLAQQMAFFSATNAPIDPLARAKGEIADVKSSVLQSIDSVLDRGDKIDLLVGKTEVLAGDSFRFKKQAVKVSSAEWLRSMRSSLAVAAAGCVALYVLVAQVCGFGLERC
jgi:vesicle-associated membrane protein 7